MADRALPQPSDQTVAIVLPWYGPATAGGAEMHARQLVAALRNAGVQIEVWTTTARDARQPLTPFYPAGWSEVEGVPVRRFAASQGQIPAQAHRDPARFGMRHAASHEIQLLTTLTSSDELLAALAAERTSRQWVFFLYAFPLSFWGAQLVGPSACLIPCLHDEPYAYYSTTRHLLRSVGCVLANSAPEAALIQRLSGISAARCPVVGEGIELGWQGDGAAFRQAHGLSGPLLYFAGRRDHSKNFPLLLAYLERYWAEHGPRPQLIVSGPGSLDVPAALRPWIHDLGYLSEAEKHAAYAAADLFCMPSLLESFSIAVMEAWLQATPVLVHADCAVTVAHCQQAQAGLWFRTYREFAACVGRLLDPALAQQLGTNGQAFVRHTCRWEDVAERFLHALGTKERS